MMYRTFIIISYILMPFGIWAAVDLGWTWTAIDITAVLVASIAMDAAIIPAVNRMLFGMRCTEALEEIAEANWPGDDAVLRIKRLATKTLGR